jgi:hypothetical protein
MHCPGTARNAVRLPFGSRLSSNQKEDQTTNRESVRAKELGVDLEELASRFFRTFDQATAPVWLNCI